MPRALKGVVLIVLIGATVALGIGFWIPVKAEAAQWLLERAWQEVRSGQPAARPWPWADTSPISRLTIPSLEASWIVLSGASGRNLAFAPSHLDGSAAPGAFGVSVIAGHRDTHFAVLEDLVRDSEIVLEDAAGNRVRYRVLRIEVVDATTTSLRLDADRAMLALVTCYPFDAVTAGGPLRYVVTAQAIAE
jgi:sortase A